MNNYLDKITIALSKVNKDTVDEVKIQMSLVSQEDTVVLKSEKHSNCNHSVSVQQSIVIIF